MNSNECGKKYSSLTGNDVDLILRQVDWKIESTRHFEQTACFGFSYLILISRLLALVTMGTLYSFSQLYFCYTVLVESELALLIPRFDTRKKRRHHPPRLLLLEKRPIRFCSCPFCSLVVALFATSAIFSFAARTKTMMTCRVPVRHIACITGIKVQYSKIGNCNHDDKTNRSTCEYSSWIGSAGMRMDL
jgi:hypothetical protein